ncbi:MAG: apolipoprotein N-acyltransferase [Phycisphaerales bacterium]|nr:apolipoprotein N-acyltransferase [Phycisphaerales bacterium]
MPCLATLVMLTSIFPPFELWPLAFVGLAPWIWSACICKRAWVAYWLAEFVGWFFFLINLYWLNPVTGLGYVALAFYLAIYWPMTVWAVRTGRRRGISPVFTLPVTWVACEFLRATVMSGFPWFFMGHALYKQLPLIQISDLGGAYAVSFVAAMINGLVVELLLQKFPGTTLEARPASRRTVMLGAIATLIVMAGSVGYGFWRITGATFTKGPRIAVIQEDFPLRNTYPYSEPQQVIFARYLSLAGQAALQEPDLIVFPETAWNAVQNRGFLEVAHRSADIVNAGAYLFGKVCDEAIAALARGDHSAANQWIERLERDLEKTERRRAPTTQPSEFLPRLPEAPRRRPVTVLVGAVSVEPVEAAATRWLRFNSALLYHPTGEQSRERYDKIHLVPFGEAVPFRHTKLHFLYRWLNALSPFSQGGKYDYSLTPGAAYTRFEISSRDGRKFRFGTPICYEDVMPYISRGLVWQDGERRADMLVNISNDGWFLHSAELPQHLAICVFRAVENRVSVARAVNTGISGFIDPNGRIYSLVTHHGRAWDAGIAGFSIEEMLLDARDSLYGRVGDWFAILCLILTGLLWFDAVGSRWIASMVRHAPRKGQTDAA